MGVAKLPFQKTTTEVLGWSGDSGVGEMALLWLTICLLLVALHSVDFKLLRALTHGKIRGKCSILVTAAHCNPIPNCPALMTPAASIWQPLSPLGTKAWDKGALGNSGDCTTFVEKGGLPGSPQTEWQHPLHSSCWGPSCPTGEKEGVC